MEEKDKDFFKEYISEIGDYIDDRALLIRLRTVKKISSILGQLISIALVGALGILIFLFLSVMLGFLLGEWFHNYWLGFGAVTLLFIIALIVVVKKRELILRKFISGIIDTILDKKEQDE